MYGTLTEKVLQAEIVGEDKLRFIGEGWIEAELFDLGLYPGAVPGTGTRVYGEVYQLGDLSVLELLDEFEDFRPTDLEGSLFVRRKVEVTMQTYKITAFAYFYNRGTKKAKKIESGRWIK